MTEDEKRVIKTRAPEPPIYYEITLLISERHYWRLYWLLVDERAPEELLDQFRNQLPR